MNSDKSHLLEHKL